MRQTLIKQIVITAGVLLLSTAGYSQVTIGSNIEPAKGALLDLKSNNAALPGGATTGTGGGGLLLPRVQLVDPSSLEPFISLAEQASDVRIKSDHKGLVVYNITNNSLFTPGQYIWSGNTWLPAGGGGGGTSGITAINGLQKDVYMPDQITLGGDLQWNTQLTQAGNDFTFQGAENQNNVMIQPRLRIQSGSPADGKVLTSDPVGNATWESAPLKGVVAGHGLATEGAGTKTSPLMVKLIDANTDGQFLKWNNTTGQWELAPGYTGTAPITVSAANAISLNDRGVTNAKLRDDAVNSAKIEDNTVTSLDILDGTITGTDIANTTITQAKLVGGTAGQVLTATGAATAPTWQAVPADPDNIVGNEVVGATLNGGLIRAGTPTAANPYTLGIAQQGVQTGMLADQAVTSIKIADGTIVNADISNNTIQADRLTGTGSSSGMVLTSSGPGTAPVWSTVYSGGVSGQVIEAGSSAAICLNAPATFTSGTTLEVIAEGSGIIVSQISTTFPGGFYNASGREGQLYDAPWVIGYSAPSYSLPRGSVIFVICALTRTRVNASWRVTPY